MESSNPLLSKLASFASTDEEVGTMNLQGTVNKTGILLLLCFGSACLSWSLPEWQMPFIIGGAIGGLITCVVGMFMPKTTPISAPIYAVLEGLCLGALSHILNARYPGVAVNALMLTLGVLALLLVAYTTRIIRVTEPMVKGIFMATAGVALVYLADFVLRIFHMPIPYIHESGPIGIGISLVIVVIAAMNLLVDFAVIESSIRARAPKYMEWYCGMALLVTLIWLYMELLRLLSKLQRR